MIIGFDTNVLAYEVGVQRHADDERKITIIEDLLDQLGPTHAFIAPIQALGELYVVLMRGGRSRPESRAVVNAVRGRYSEVASGSSTLGLALELATNHKLQFWDSLILGACSEAGCAVVLSEDMGHGFAWRGLTVINPFAADADQRLARLLA